jgi:ABC-type bacteriocin/lantibiotic exporter with double-glycine peptidase domain
MNNNDKPVVLNVNGNHYIVAIGTRRNTGKWQMKIVDPADGIERWEDTRGTGNKVQQVYSTAVGAWYTLTVAYYIA